MISFDKIDEHSVGYEFLVSYLSFVHNCVYYRRFHIINRENIPKKGTPTLIIANHQNGMMDAMAILHTIHKNDKIQPVFIARGDIFKKDAIAKVLRFLKILPVFRSRDGGKEDIKKDLQIFSRAAKILADGGTLAIFPEAGHQQGHFMNTFKKGFSRIAFSAEEMKDFNLNLQILPLNIHYSNYFKFGCDLAVTCGKPFTINDLTELYRESPNLAYNALNEKAKAIVKAMTPDIDVPEFRPEFEALMHIVTPSYLKRKSLDYNYLPNRKDTAMSIIDALKNYKNSDADGFANLMEQTKTYVSGLKKSGLHNRSIDENIATWKFIATALGLLCTFPIFAFGFVCNFIPTYPIKFYVNKLKDPMFRSTFQYVMSAVLFPIWYIILLIVASVASHSLLFGLGFCIISAATFMFCHHYKRYFRKFRDAFQGFRLKNSSIYKSLSNLKSEILRTTNNLLAND